MNLQRQKERICRKLNDGVGIQFSLGNQANLLFGEGKFQAALPLYREKELMCRQLGMELELGACMNNHALAHLALGECATCINLLRESERVFGRLGDKIGLQAAIGNLALALHSRRELRDAKELLQHQEVICRQIGYKTGLSASLHNQEMVTQEHDFDRISPRPRWFKRSAMRIADITLASAGLLAFAMILPPIVVLMKIENSGPLFISRVRIRPATRHTTISIDASRAGLQSGQRGIPFRSYRLRTMSYYPPSHKERGWDWVEAHDPRITRIGSILRITRLDRAPDLVNVVRGHVTLFSATPERLPIKNEHLEKRDIEHEDGHVDLPGIRGVAQLLGGVDEGLTRSGVIAR